MITEGELIHYTQESKGRSTKTIKFKLQKKDGIRMKNKTLKIIIYSIIIVLVCFTLIWLPFLIEWILYDTEHMLFHTPIRFSREAWFGFIASYLGAIGTVILGIIALYQNRRYKELSDKSEATLLNLQNEIRELNYSSANILDLHFDTSTLKTA